MPLHETIVASLRPEARMRLFEEIVENSPDLTFVLDLNTMAWVYVNRRAATALGFSAAELVNMEGSILHRLMDADQAIQCIDALKAHACLTPHQVRRQVFRMISRFGEVVRFDARLSPFSFDHYGEATHLLCVAALPESFTMAAVGANVEARIAT